MSIVERNVYCASYSLPYKGNESLVNAMHKAKNLYNATLWYYRQALDEHQKAKEEGRDPLTEYPDYYKMERKFRDERQINYFDLPQKVSQWVLRDVQSDWRSFMKLIVWKKSLPDSDPRKQQEISPPHYKYKDGYARLRYTKQAFSLKAVPGKVVPSGTDTALDIPKFVNPYRITQLVIEPEGDRHMRITFIYKVDLCDMLVDNGKVAGADLGVNNLVTILQITDIHINGEYNGQFDVKKHFKQILEANRTRDFDAIALTGDLADDGSYEDYVEIFNQVEETFGNGTPILAIPGNHDNREHLDRAYMDYINREHNFKPGAYLQRIGGTFEEPGKCVVILTLPVILVGSGNTKLIGMDNAHKELPHQGLEAFLDHEWNRKGSDSYTLFMHMPLIKPFHRFMNADAHSIDEDAAKTFLWALREFDFRGIFCGHYHCASVVAFDDFVQFVAPASQCQLDPFAKECSPSGNYPGYAIVCPDMHERHMCKFHYIVEDQNGN